MNNYVKKIVVLAVPGIFGFLYVSSLAASAPVVRLQAPDLSAENFIGYNIGHRPCRSGGLRLEHEWLDNGKLLVHNYGHGGAGVSLSWGCAAQVANIVTRQATQRAFLGSGYAADKSAAITKQGLETYCPGTGCSAYINEIRAEQVGTLDNYRVINSNKVAVIGAGIIGLTVAHALLECGFEVCVYAQAFPPDTMSDVAVGVFTSDLCVTMADPLMLERIKDFAKKRMAKIVAGDLVLSGVRIAPGYYFSRSDIETAAPEDLRMVDFGLGLEPKVACFREIITVDIPVYMQSLVTKIQAMGATLISAQFASKEAIFNVPEDVIINCTGMASRWLFNDEALYHVRGELLYFKAQPGVDYRLHFANPGDSVFTSLSTWGDRIIIGGSLEQMVDHFEVDIDICNGLYANIQNLIAPGRTPRQLDAGRFIPADYCNGALR